jgi:hypothetical protein
MLTAIDFIFAPWNRIHVPLRKLENFGGTKMLKIDFREECGKGVSGSFLFKVMTSIWKSKEIPNKIQGYLTEITKYGTPELAVCKVRLN